MASMTSKQFANAASELQANFRGSTWDRIKELHDLVDNRKDYRPSLNPMILPEQRINIGPAILRYYNQKLVTEIRNRGYALHIEPHGGRVRDDKAADTLEVFEGWAWQQIDKTGYIDDTICTEQVGGLYWAGLMEMKEWQDPEQRPHEKDGEYAERRERMRKAFFPFGIDVKRPDTVAWAEYNRELTAFAVEETIPFIEFMERFGKEYKVSRHKMDQLWSVQRNHFGYLNEAHSEDRNQDMMRNGVKVCIFGDMHKVYFYVDKGGNDESRYNPAGTGEWEHHFGMVPLLLAEGFYNGNRPVNLRREGVLVPSIDIEDQKAYIKTHWASQAFAIPWFVAENEMEEYWKLDPKERPNQYNFETDDAGRPRILAVPGKIKNVMADVNPLLDKLYSILDVDGRIAAPTPNISMTGESRVNEPVSRDVMQLEAITSMLSHALDSRAEVRHKALDAFENAFQYQLNKHRDKGAPKDEKDWTLEFIAAGNERPYGREVERGTVYEITPQIVELEKTRTLIPVDNRTSTKMVNLQYAVQLKAAGGTTDDGYLELLGIEDVSAFKERYNADRDKEALDPVLDVAAKVAWAELQVLETGRPVEEFLTMAAQVQMPGSAPMPSGSQPNTMTVTPPSSDQGSIAGQQGMMGQ
jgi:hypothetical protein